MFLAEVAEKVKKLGYVKTTEEMTCTFYGETVHVGHLPYKQ